MWFKMINDSFLCENCGKKVSKHPLWSARNHCLYCLYSKHLDEEYPWDRKSDCFGLMEPIWIDYKKNKGYMLRHRCRKCNKVILNKVAPDDDFLDFSKKINRNL